MQSPAVLTAYRLEKPLKRLDPLVITLHRAKATVLMKNKMRRLCDGCEKCRDKLERDRGRYSDGPWPRRVLISQPLIAAHISQQIHSFGVHRRAVR